MYLQVEDFLTRVPAQLIYSLLNDENYQSVNWSNPSDPLRLRLQSLISDAESEINGYLSRYQIHFNQLPPVLSVCASDITLYNCYRRRVSSQIPDYVYKAYQDRITFLLKISRAELSLEAPMDNPSGYIAVAWSPGNFLEV